jgi:hypothetical protein
LYAESAGEWRCLRTRPETYAERRKQVTTVRLVTLSEPHQRRQAGALQTRGQSLSHCFGHCLPCVPPWRAFVPLFCL